MGVFVGEAYAAIAVELCSGDGLVCDVGCAVE